MPGADEEELSNADKSGLIKIAKKYFKDRKHLTNPNYAAGINLDWIKSALETGEYEFEHKDPLRLVEMYLKRVQDGLRIGFKIPEIPDQFKRKASPTSNEHRQYAAKGVAGSAIAPPVKMSLENYHPAIQLWPLNGHAAKEWFSTTPEETLPSFEDLDRAEIDRAVYLRYLEIAEDYCASAQRRNRTDHNSTQRTALVKYFSRAVVFLRACDALAKESYLVDEKAEEVNWSDVQEWVSQAIQLHEDCERMEVGDFLATLEERITAANQRIS